MDGNQTPYCFFTNASDFAKPARECLPHIRDPLLREIAAGFAKNFDDIFDLCVFPLKLAMVGLSGQREMMNFMSACMRSHQSATRYGKDPKATEAIRAELAKIRGEEETRKWLDDNASGMVVAMLQAEDMQPTVRNILLLVLSASWTLFEALSTDLWTALVNSRPTQLGGQVISNISDQRGDGEVANRGISLRLLAKHGFNLSNVLGTLLNRRFDFSSLSGIRRAYRSAFPGLDLGILDSADLKLLQAYRHVIVHRAGAADQSFVDTSGLANVILGRPVPLEERAAERMLIAAAECGSQIVRMLDGWVREHPARS
jgi:hypothetical protein